MVFSQLVLLFFVALLAGTINSVAGGGGFFTIPTMIFFGMLPVLANTTSTIALWTGTAASIGPYRHELAQVRLKPTFRSLNREWLPERLYKAEAMTISAIQTGFRGQFPKITAECRLKLMALLVSTSLIGGILGAILLLHTPQGTFLLLLPYLLLIATLLFTFSGLITKRLHVHNIGEQVHLSLLAIIGVAVAQFIIAIYGGYFGGGAGILMLAMLALTGMENIHSMNALKVLLATSINGVAVITFIIANAVIWPQAISMIVGATIGGYSGAYFARKIEQKWIQYTVMVVRESSKQESLSI